MKNSKILPVLCLILGFFAFPMVLEIWKLIKTEPVKEKEWPSISDFCSVAQSAMFATAYDLVGEGESKQVAKRRAIADIKRLDAVSGSMSTPLCSPIPHPVMVCPLWPHDLDCWANQFYLMGWSVQWWFPHLDASLGDHPKPASYDRLKTGH